MELLRRRFMRLLAAFAGAVAPPKPARAQTPVPTPTPAEQQAKPTQE